MQDKTETLKKKTIKKRGSFFIKLAVGILFLLIISVFLYRTFIVKNKTFSSYIVLSKMEKKQAEPSEYRGYIRGLVSYNREGIIGYDDGLSIISNFPLNMTKPKIRVTGGYLAIYDAGGRKIVVVNNNITPAAYANFETVSDILDLDISEQGEFAVLTVKDDGNEIKLIDPFDKNSEIKAEIRTYEKQDGSAMSVAISKDGSKLVTSYVNGVDNSIKSTLTFYNFGKLGENSNVDRIVGIIPYEDTIFPKLSFLDNDVLVSYGDNKIIAFNTKREPSLIFEKEIKPLLYVADDRDGFSFVESAEESGYTLSSYDKAGRLKFTKELETKPRGLSIEYGEIILYFDNKLLIVNSNGSIKYSGKFNERLIRVVGIGRNSMYFVILENKMEVIKLSE